MKVFVLKIRVAGDEDEVFLFDAEEKARLHAVKFFQEYGYTEPLGITCWNGQVVTFGDNWELGYGYFTITEQEIN